MAANPKDGKLLYHLTAINNLPTIISEGLKPRGLVNEFTDIADQEIIEHRNKYNLNQYVPFHFFTSTPFAGAAQKGNIETNFVYLTIDREHAVQNSFKIIPQHPLSFKDHPLNYEEGFEKINWGLISKRDYQDHDCKEACMAECVSETIVLFKSFRFIYVKNDDDLASVKAMVKDVETHPKFAIFKNEGMFVK